MADQEQVVQTAPPQLAFRALGGDFFLLQLGNLALTIVTIGIYRFWGKTRYRRFLWRNTWVGEDPLEYQGRGLELFVGALLVVLFVSIPIGLLTLLLPLLLGRGEGTLLIVQAIVILAIYYLLGVGIYKSWRYMLSRSSWRGIRGGMIERGWRFGLYNYGLVLAQLFSLGFATPWVGVRRWNRLVGDIRIGNLALAADARSAPLYKRFLLVWATLVGATLLVFGVIFAAFGAALMADIRPDAPPDLGALLGFILAIYGGMFVVAFVGSLAFAHYHAKVLRVTFGATSLGETMRLRFDVTTREVLVYYLVNMALVIFTGGLGLLLMPYRHWQFHADRIRIDGAFDEGAMRQTDLVGPGQGEGLADAFDLSPF